ncbi:MAG: tetratricopeptide repeat protein [Elusimicrobia bacterium]|nr:tetratricopeptide repeat protein [Elusimicrobiota bacterium]
MKDAARYSVFLRRSARRLLGGDAAGGWADLMRAYEVGPDFMFAYAEARDASARGRRGADDRIPDERLLKALARPQHASDWAWRGLLRRRTGDYAGAVADLDRAWVGGLRTSMILTWRGEARLHLGDAEGMKDMEKALTSPCHAWNHAWCGRAKTAFGRSPAALAHFDRAIKLAPRNGWYLAWRAEAKRLLGVKKGVLADFDKALRLDPGYDYQAWVRTWRGHARLQAGKAAGALADFDAALKKKPGYALAVSGRMRAQRALGRWKDWLADLEKVSRLDAKHVHAWYNRPREELAELARDLDKARGGAVASKWRGFFRLLLGDFSGAHAAFERAAGLKKDPWLHAWTAQLAEQEGRAADALASYDRAVRLAPKDPVIRAWRARLHLAAGQTSAALADFDRALASDQRYAWIFADRGRVRLMSGKAALAAADFEKASILDGNDAGLWADLAAAYGACRRPADRKRALARASSIDPTKASARLKIWQDL